jgi:DNA-binding MarR family transcriptional regulator
MNAIAFGTKRAFHGFLRVTRKQLASLGLTAARFDMLSALLDARPAWLRGMGVWQSELREVLGVTAPVVTRMVQALEVLGLVRREREEYGDRRQVVVTLTRAGARCILKARKVVLPDVRERVFGAISVGRHRYAQERWVRMDALESYLCALRGKFGDASCLHYPWGHPDD